MACESHNRFNGRGMTMMIMSGSCWRMAKKKETTKGKMNGRGTHTHEEKTFTSWPDFVVAKSRHVPILQYGIAFEPFFFLFVLLCFAPMPSADSSFFLYLYVYSLSFYCNSLADFIVLTHTFFGESNRVLNLE